MNPEFWIKAWNEGKTAFHQTEYHEKLVEFFPRLNSKKGQRVLVPLCGKSKDLLWLHGLNLQVHGVELHLQAVEDFFSENKLAAPEKRTDRDFTHYAQGDMVISCGDFFKLDERGAYDFIYDRAALVALPSSMRDDYARVTKQALKVGGKYLLIVYDYDQSKMEGPPFSVDSHEIRRLYQDQFRIELMASEAPKSESSRLAAVEGLQHKTYILEKLR